MRPTQTPTRHPSARKSPPPDRPCCGGFFRTRNGRSAAPFVHRQPGDAADLGPPAAQLRPPVDPDRRDHRAAGRLLIAGGEAGHVGERGASSQADDRQVAGGIRRRHLGRDGQGPRRARLGLLDAEVIAVQLDPERALALDHVRGRQDQRLALDRGDHRPAPLRRLLADHDRRPKRPVVVRLGPARGRTFARGRGGHEDEHDPTEGQETFRHPRNPPPPMLRPGDARRKPAEVSEPAP